MEPRPIPRELWATAAQVIRRPESLGLELATKIVTKSVTRTLSSWRTTRFRPVMGWTVQLEPVAPGPVGVVLGHLPLPQAVVVLSVATAADVLGAGPVVVTAPDEPEGGVSALTISAAHLGGAGQLCALEADQALVALAEGSSDLPACAHIFAPAAPELVALADQLRARLGVGFTFFGAEDLVAVVDGGADAEQLAWELVAHCERSPWGRRGLVTTSQALSNKVARLLRQNGPDGATAFCMAVETGEAAEELLRAVLPDVVWVLAAQPDIWLERLAFPATFLVGGHAPPSLAEVGIPPWLGTSPFGGKSMGPTPLHGVRTVVEVGADRLERAVRYAAEMARAEKRASGAAALLRYL